MSRRAHPPLLSRLNDLLVLRPNQRPIEADGKTRRLLDVPDGQCEAWLRSQFESEDSQAVRID